MDLGAFMMIAGVNTGESTDAAAVDPHTGAIEILTFEHEVQRTQGRTLQNALDQLDQAYQLAIAPVPNPHAGGSQAESVVSALLLQRQLDLRTQQAARVRQQGRQQQLAQNFERGSLVVYKCLDATTPKLCELSSQENFLATVDVVVRGPVTPNTPANAVYRDLFRITLKNAWIIDYEAVGDFAVQGWNDLAIHPHLARQLLDVGPVERIEFTYKTVQWKYGTNPKTGWDFDGTAEDIN